MQNFVEKGKHDCWPWLGHPDDAINSDSKMACNDGMCCNPQHVIEVDGSKTQKGAEDAAEDAESELDVLRQQCEQAGIYYDRRWGIEKMEVALSNHSG
ncbi:MAG: hypothetical protein L3J21_09895 [Devosiaceae bacterium]|nr:hypothetical protein [Devosiaceae bacterium]